MHGEQRLWYRKQFWVFCAPRIFAKCHMPHVVPRPVEKDVASVPEEQEVATELKHENSHEAATCIPVCSQYLVCPRRRLWKKFVGFLREKCAGKRSPKSPKPSMDETTSSSYPQSHGQAWGPVLALDWSHSGRGDPTLREYERHWRRGENK